MTGTLVPLGTVPSDAVLQIQLPVQFGCQLQSLQQPLLHFFVPTKEQIKAIT